MTTTVDLKKRLTLILKELHLPTIRVQFEELAIQAEAESLSYERYLLELIENERDARRQRRIERCLKESGLPFEKTLSVFDLKRLPQKAKRQVNYLLEGDFLGKKENVLLFGKPGSGKTHLICGISQELIRRGHRILFTTCGMLVQKLLIAKRDLELAKLIKKLSKFEAIVIDDIGYVQHSREEMEVLFTFLAERYERGSVMITSNLPFSKWEKIFKDPMTTAAAIDRVVHHSVILELNIDSYRMETAQINQTDETE